jgi:hypothetical protein
LAGSKVEQTAEQWAAALVARMARSTADKLVAWKVVTKAGPWAEMKADYLAVHWVARSAARLAAQKEYWMAVPTVVS